MTDQLIAMIYRPESAHPCRQYPFHSFEELEQWLKRKRNKGEALKVYEVENMSITRHAVLRDYQVIGWLHQPQSKKLGRH